MNAKVRHRRRRRAHAARQRKLADYASRTHVRWMYPDLRNVQTLTLGVRRNVAYVKAVGWIDGTVTAVDCQINVRI